MDFMHWECLDKLGGASGGCIIDVGPLLGGGRKYRIRRTPKQGIEMVVETAVDGPIAREIDKKEIPAGTVCVNTDSVLLHVLGLDVLLSGVTSHSTQAKYDPDASVGVCTETASVHKIIAKPGQANDVYQTVEWVGNFVLGRGMLPDLLREEGEETFVRRFGGEVELDQTVSVQSKFHGRCLNLYVEGVRLVVFETAKGGAENILGGACVLYAGMPDRSVRDKIRDCLSFALGRPLTYFGCEWRSSKGYVLGLEAVSVYSANGAYYDVTTSPPCVLHGKYDGLLSGVVVNDVVSRLYAHYEALDLKNILSMYWCAVSLPVVVSAVHFGSAIEALQTIGRKSGYVSVQTSIVEKGAARSLISAYEQAVGLLDVSEDSKKALLAKSQQLNSASFRVQSMRFFEALNISMGELELRAWGRRNDAAHGVPVDGDADFVGLIRDLKLLRNIFNRTLLSLAKVSSEYVDYYSLGHPRRPLSQAAE